MPPLLRTLAVLPVLASASCVDTVPTGPGNPILTAGAFRNVSLDANISRVYTITVPAGTGTLRIETRDGPTSLTMAVRANEVPSPGSNDCDASAELMVQECLIESPVEGVWRIQLINPQGYNGMRLRASLYPQTGATPIASGGSANDLSGTEGSFRLYSIDVPAGHTLTAMLANGTGDADLFIRRGAYPTFIAYDCISVSGNSNELCTASAAAATTMYIRVHGWGAYSAADLTVNVAPTP